MNYWDRIRQYLQDKVSAESYENWLKGAQFQGVDGGTLLVAVPDNETRAWLETEYAALVRKGIQDLALPVNAVHYSAQQEQAARIRVATVGESSQEIESPVSALNPKFTFDSFVVGACNQFAHAAACSVATNPSRSYN